jgi:catechol 2,3-dioxygenase-like lactoylglutathione lyase family enzyme
LEPRITLVSLGVMDLAASRRFYEQGLGWKVSNASNDSIAFIDLGGPVLGLYGRDALADDANLPHSKPGAFGGFALAHNVRSKEEVDRVLKEAEAAGAKILKPAEDVFWGGYSGYFADPDGHPWEVAWNPLAPLDENGRMTLPE